ncbi:MAG: dihydrodipicolinate synthase family protein [Acidobacteria bacterium]|jgi:4-hydroxy-2-oxoglutarate aldolase|nr:MAG: dihydrodipicolinate synthase family protein [Acidobacteriota bacterium]
MLLHGIFPPITTPFYPDGNVYHKKLEANVERYSRTPAAGIVVQGSTGEAILLSDQERRDVLKTAIAAAAPNKVMIAGTGIESAHETIKLTEYAAELGYDAAMVRTPHYYKKQMAPANILAFYRTVADRSPLPILIYNFPGATGYDIPAELVAELSDHPNIIGIKESSGNLEKVKTMVEGTRHVKRSATVTDTFDAVTPRMLKAAASESSNGGQLVSVEALGGAAKTEPAKLSSSAVTVVGKMKTRQKEVGFQVLVGAAHQLEASLALGAVGAIVAFASPAPMACYEIYAAIKDNDSALAREKQERVKLAAQRIVSDIGVPGVKYAMDLNGYYGGPARLPFLPLTADLKSEIEKLMAGIKS